MMVIPSDLLGMENFSQAYGFMLAGEGLGVYLGPPLVGKLIAYRLTYFDVFFSLKKMFCLKLEADFYTLFCSRSTISKELQNIF